MGHLEYKEWKYISFVKDCKKSPIITHKKRLLATTCEKFKSRVKKHQN